LNEKKGSQVIFLSFDSTKEKNKGAMERAESSRQRNESSKESRQYWRKGASRSHSLGSTGGNERES